MKDSGKSLTFLSFQGKFATTRSLTVPEFSFVTWPISDMAVTWKESLALVDEGLYCPSSQYKTNVFLILEDKQHLQFEIVLLLRSKD